LAIECHGFDVEISTRKAGNGITLNLKSNVKTLGSPQNITTALKKNKQLSSVEMEPNNDTDENVKTTSRQDILQFLPENFFMTRQIAKDIPSQSSTNNSRNWPSNASALTPIRYGFSLNMKTVRGMLGEIVKAICDRDLNVKAEAFDGQFLELFVED
jgi:hypothetical protein